MWSRLAFILTLSIGRTRMNLTRTDFPWRRRATSSLAPTNPLALDPSETFANYETSLNSETPPQAVCRLQFDENGGQGENLNIEDRDKSDSRDFCPLRHWLQFWQNLISWQSLWPDHWEWHWTAFTIFAMFLFYFQTWNMVSGKTRSQNELRN